jgi:hypothetical protein
MISPHKNTLRVLVAFLVLLGTTLACYVDAKETEIDKSDKEFDIDSSTILEALAQGKKDVFTERKETPAEESTARREEPVNWSQADYFRVANALHQFTWNEPLDSMNLYSMYFSLSCDEAENGFQYTQLRFYRVIETDKGEARINRGIEIDPRTDYAAAWEAEYYPNLSKWKPIDLSKVEITADQALQIAENDGGRDKRIAAGNECYITIVMSTDTIHYRGWTIDYSNADYADVFYDEIDPVTGK